VIGLMPVVRGTPRSVAAGCPPFWLLVSNPSLLLSNSEFFNHQPGRRSSSPSSRAH